MSAESAVIFASRIFFINFQGGASIPGTNPEKQQQGEGRVRDAFRKK